MLDPNQVANHEATKTRINRTQYSNWPQYSNRSHFGNRQQYPHRPTIPFRANAYCMLVRSMQFGGLHKLAWTLEVARKALWRNASFRICTAISEFHRAQRDRKDRCD
jgi:hypothetical protein